MNAIKFGRHITCWLLAFVLLPVAWADQIIFKNGDRVTGSIVKKDEKQITIKTDNFGVVAAPWDQVESVIAEKPIHIVLSDGREIQGTVKASGTTAEVTTDQAKMNLATADLAAMRNDDEEKAYQRLLKPGWTQLWAGTGTIGFAGASGNAQTATFTAGLNADRVTKTDKTSLFFSLIRASATLDNERQDADAVRGGISYDHNVNRKLFFNVFNDYEYDRFQDLDLRFVLGGGAGYHVWNDGKSQLDLLAGGAYNRSSFSTPLVRSSGELYWGNEYLLKLGSAVTLVQSYRMFNDLDDTSIYRVNFDIGLSTKLLKWLSWNVSLSDRYLSEPAPGRKTNDFLYTTGIGITFAR
jgi:putative salt-induced outer membrane protein YdiY